MDLPATPSEVVAALGQWLDAAEQDDPLVVTTSGSTGRPKRVVLTRDAVLASARASAARLGTSGAWLLTLPPSYVAGANVVVRSLLAGHDPELLGEHGQRSIAEATDALAARVPAGTDLFCSLVPTQLRRVLDGEGRDATGATADREALARYRTVLLGGGPVGATLREQAAAAGITVVATYGAAETCGGCVYDGVPLDGAAVALGTDGRVRLTGPMLFSGYDGDPDLTAEVLAGGWFLTADAGRLDHDGRLEVLGRLDDVVVSGGLNVPAPAVAERLRSHPDVAAVEVLGVEDAEWGHRLVAFVVPRSPEVPPSLAELREHVAADRPRPWAPRQLVVLDDLPLLTNGKPDRVVLRRLAADRADQADQADQSGAPA